MPDCTSCPSSNRGQPAPICIYCVGPSENFHNDGQNFVALDHEEALKVAEQDHVEETNHDEATEFARRILTLETWDREIICRRLAGESLSDIARQLGLVFGKRITVQAVSFRVKRLVKKYRILEVMLVSDKRKGVK